MSKSPIIVKASNLDELQTNFHAVAQKLCNELGYFKAYDNINTLVTIKGTSKSKLENSILEKQDKQYLFL